MRRKAVLPRADIRLSCRRETAADICWVNRKASAPERMAMGQPENSASAALKVALANRQVSIIRNRVMAHSQTNPWGVWGLDRFQFVNRNSPCSQERRRLAIG